MVIAMLKMEIGKRERREEKRREEKRREEKKRERKSETVFLPVTLLSILETVPGSRFENIIFVQF